MGTLLELGQLRKAKHAVIVAVLLAALLFCVIGFRAEFRFLVEYVLTKLREAGPYAFFLSMAILPAFGFPLLPFALMAGPAFNPSLGSTKVTLFAILSVAVNVTLSYALSNRIFGPLIHRALKRLGYSIPELPTGTSWQAVFIIRLAPGLPFWVQSYLLGLLAVPFLPYIVVSTLVPSMYLTGAIIFGGAAWQGHTKVALLGASFLGLIACAVSIWRKRNAYRTLAKSAL